MYMRTRGLQIVLGCNCQIPLIDTWDETKHDINSICVIEFLIILLIMNIVKTLKLKYLAVVKILYVLFL